MTWLLLAIALYGCWRLLRVRRADTITDEWLTDHYIRSAKKR